jgi:hypothetical protein
VIPAVVGSNPIRHPSIHFPVDARRNGIDVTIVADAFQ